MNEVRQEIVSKVNQLMSDGFEIPAEKLVPHAKLYEDLSLDSLDAVDMLVHLEDSLGVKVAGERFMHVRTLEDVYNVIQDVLTESKAEALRTKLVPAASTLPSTNHAELS